MTSSCVRVCMVGGGRAERARAGQREREHELVGQVRADGHVGREVGEHLVGARGRRPSRRARCFSPKPVKTSVTCSLSISTMTTLPGPGRVGTLLDGERRRLPAASGAAQAGQLALGDRARQVGDDGARAARAERAALLEHQRGQRLRRARP